MLVRSDKAWDYAIGRLKADGFEPTPEMMEMIEKKERGEMKKKRLKKRLTDGIKSTDRKELIS